MMVREDASVGFAPKNRCPGNPFDTPGPVARIRETNGGRAALYISGGTVESTTLSRGRNYAMQKQRLALIAAGLLVAAIAASPAQATPAVDYDISVDAKDKLTIEVINNYALDVRVFVVAENGESQEIGTVRRLNTKSLSVPSSILEDAGKIRIKVVTLEATRRPAAISARRCFCMA